MKRKAYSPALIQFAAQAFHRVVHAQPACHARLVEVPRLGQRIVQTDKHGDPYPAADLRRCWRREAVYRTPLLTSFEVRQ